MARRVLDNLHKYLFFWRHLKNISFRDALISNPEFVVEYANLKKELVNSYSENRQAYTDGKTEFVNKVLM
ncbi:GrpB family protein [Paenibacillus sp. MER 99-2]|uniref:GrpB family protein n=1 Tax=Paenibacillus TaxID=44249 RepID=UPI00334064C2